MEVRVSAAGDDSGVLESLGDWLKGEPELAGRVRMCVPTPRDGEMGALAEALVVAAGSGGTLSVLAASLHAWLSQPRRSRASLRIQSSDGRVLDLSLDRVDAQQAGALLRQALDLEIG